MPCCTFIGNNHILLQWNARLVSLLLVVKSDNVNKIVRMKDCKIETLRERGIGYCTAKFGYLVANSREKQKLATAQPNFGYLVANSRERKKLATAQPNLGYLVATNT